MRIAIVNSVRRQLGGAESYLATVLPEFAASGHELLLWHEWDGPDGRPEIHLPGSVAAVSVATQGEDGAVKELRDWRPDVIYCHGLRDLSIEKRVLDAAPAVLLAHNYYGTCVSGTKAHQFPTTRPCARRLGPGCLACYFPRRCGGLNPMTMWRLYRSQQRRLALLDGYRGIVTASAYMREEYIRHGFAPERVWHVPLCLARSRTEMMALPRADGEPADAAWRLLFVGRLERLKGVQILLSSLRDLPRLLGRTVHLTVAGDGSDRPALEARAARQTRGTPGLIITFEGWVGQERLDELFRAAHLLVFPSVWPEPFGLVGPEAGRYGVPAAAFNVGGISDWLKAGENGALAAADPPTAPGLAAAIVECLCDPAHYARLRRGARCQSERFADARAHVNRVADLLAAACGVPSS